MQQPIFALLFFLMFYVAGEASMPQLQELSIEEKVGQLLITHFNGNQVNPDAQRLIEKAYVGGFIYYNWANGLTDPHQVQTLSSGLQKLAEMQPHAIPLFITIDQEGGVVNRLKEGFTLFPGNYAIAQTKNVQLAEKVAFAMGEELRAVGVNMNLAPVVDVNAHSFNPTIGIRAFSHLPNEVVKFGAKALAGYHNASIMTVLKHFPGHGDVTVDSHIALPIVYKSQAELEAQDLIPFKALASQTDVIMTAHLLVPALDKNRCVTLSTSIIQGLLREEMKFEGLIMTDSLVMQGLLSQCSSIEEAAIQSFEAGHDLLLLGGKQLDNSQNGFELTVEDVLKIHQALVAAVHQGRISEERLNASVQRILNLKSSYSLVGKPTFDLLAKKINTSEHQHLAQEVASCALKIVYQEKLPLSQQSVLVVAPEVLQQAIDQTTLLQVGRSTKGLFFENLNPIEEEQKKILFHAKEADSLIVCSYNSWKYPKQLDLIKELQQLAKPMIVLVTRDPQDASLITKAQVVMCTFSPVPISIQTAINSLKNE